MFVRCQTVGEKCVCVCMRVYELHYCDCCMCESEIAGVNALVAANSDRIWAFFAQ